MCHIWLAPFSHAAQLCGPLLAHGTTFLRSHLKPKAYTQTVDSWQNPNEDSRGVDVGQIRDLLRMSVADRVHEMVRVANMMERVRANAREGKYVAS